jgi:hypothetical protein
MTRFFIPAFVAIVILVSDNNALMLAEDNVAPAGFTAMFNGHDLMGWEGAIPIAKRLKLSGVELKEAQEAANKRILPHWSAENGVLVNDGNGDNLASVKHYKNFELLLDWKIEPKGDSGIYLRGLPQVQIWDSDTLDPKRFAKDLKKGSGALWNNAKNNLPLKRADKAAGEWNTFRIIMKGDKVTVWLNGELVVDQAVLENIFDRKSPAFESGPIELQRHPKQDGTLGKLWFKNIYIKELD